MLTRLQVRNFAIIDEIEVEFGSGMTVLTGETGAGKSILVDALGLVLGERGGAGLVREGADRAEFAAAFDLSSHAEARNWLTEQALDLGDECLLRRVVGADGRSRAFINGNAAPLQSVKELGEMLVDIHGQHFHQSLGRRSVQRDLLDHFGGLQAYRAATAEAYTCWRAVHERLQQLEQAEADRAARLELLAFQAQELEGLGASSGEHEELLAERRKLRMSVSLAEAVARALQAVDENEDANVQSLLSGALQALEGGRGVDEDLQAVHSMLEEASIQVSEAAAALRRYGESLEADPARRDWVEERLDAMQLIARKHRVEPSALPEVQEQLLAQLAELRDAEATGARLAQEAATAKEKYIASAKALSKGRAKAATEFASQVASAMHGLGMPGGVFRIAITSRHETDARASGLDDVEYLISANPGQPPMPLGRVASGGELSRMSLAIQVIASDGSAIPTMVFDEVDSGVGGGVAEMVGRRLQGLGNTRQVFCVTHLPQVASLANQHIRISKVTDGKVTRTEVVQLDREQRVEELARMLGGVKITRRTRDHAEEMLEAASAG